METVELVYFKIAIWLLVVVHVIEIHSIILISLNYRSGRVEWLLPAREALVVVLKVYNRVIQPLPVENGVFTVLLCR